MEEEVSKHTKKIYKAIKAPEHSFWEKLKEVAVEIFIIVFAVTLSIWFHNWSDQRHEQREAGEFLTGLKDDLSKDIQLLDTNITSARKVDSDFHFIRRLYQNPAMDTVSLRVITHYLNFEMLSTHSNIGRYEGFKSSGKIGTINDDSLKQMILVYYQQTVPGLPDIEGIVNSFQTRILDMEIDRDDPASLKVSVRSFKMQALLEFGTKNIEAEIRAYEEAQKQARHIIARIDHRSPEKPPGLTDKPSVRR